MKEYEEEDREKLLNLLSKLSDPEIAKILERDVNLLTKSNGREELIKNLNKKCLDEITKLRYLLLSVKNMESDINILKQISEFYMK